MYPNYFMVGKAMLLVVGAYWCLEVFGRFGKDVAELRTSSDLTTKGIILSFWLLTAGIVALMWKIIQGNLQPVIDLL